MPLSNCHLFVHLTDLSRTVRLACSQLQHRSSLGISVISCLVFASAMQAEDSLWQFHDEFLFLAWNFSVLWPLCRQTDLCSPALFIASSAFGNLDFEIVCVIKGSRSSSFENDQVERLDLVRQKRGIGNNHNQKVEISWRIISQTRYSES
jgi:hypothetical protein